MWKIIKIYFLQSFSISTRLTFLRIVPDSKNQQTFVDYFGYIWWRVHTSYKKLIEIVVVLYGFNQICRNFGPHVRGILPSARLYSTTEAFTCGVAQQFWVLASKYRVHCATSSFFLFLLNLFWQCLEFSRGCAYATPREVRARSMPHFHFHLLSLIFLRSAPNILYFNQIKKCIHKQMFV